MPVVLPEGDLDPVDVRELVVVAVTLFVPVILEDALGVLEYEADAVVDGDAVELELDETDTEADPEKELLWEGVSELVDAPLTDSLVVDVAVADIEFIELRVDVKLFDAVDAAVPVTEAFGLLEPLAVTVVDLETLIERVPDALAVELLLVV